MTNLAIAHKDYDVRGGGERLAEELARTFDAPMYVGRRDTDNVPEASDIQINEIELARWQRFAIKRGGKPRSFAYWIAWQNAHALADYDTVITSGNEPLWYPPTQEQTVIAYTHSTPRWQFDLYHENEHGTVDTLAKTAQRVLYSPNINYPDVWVANSDIVARRLERYFSIDRDRIHVVYPPVKTRSFSHKHDVTQDYYLYLGRLAGTKRVDEVVAAANELDQPLKIAGDGPQHKALSKQAGPTVDVLGRVSENKKRRLFAGAKALVYPCANEDFGMVPIEAMASGTPVVGVREGFTQYQISDGYNGLLYDREDGIGDALERFERDGVAWDEIKTEAWAGEHFAVERFREEMQAIVRQAERAASVNPTLAAEGDRIIQ